MSALDFKCSCAACGNNTPFEIPEQLYDALCNGDVVLFAGAGISTENRFVFPSPLAEEVCGELCLDVSPSLGFPDLMSRYCEQPNGRPRLLRKIRHRFEYVESFSDLYRAATRFHRELATLFPIQNIITTNWDDYFERECGAIPFVHSEDFVFWDSPGRKVFKIHGSINNLGSLVITRTDYERTFDRLSQDLIGSYLRMMLGTKTLIYIGFSFADDDVIRIHESLMSGMSGLTPQAYIVTPDDASDSRFQTACSYSNPY
jgi:SIR2-like domain